MELAMIQMILIDLNISIQNQDLETLLSQVFAQKRNQN